MIKLNLTTSCKEHELIKEFLEQNVSETLAEKINNGVRIEKDGILEGLPPVDTNCQLFRREAVHVSDFT